MNDEKLQTLEQVNRFLEGSEALEFRGLTIEEIPLDRGGADKS